jgi:hypothetical protein
VASVCFVDEYKLNEKNIFQIKLSLSSLFGIGRYLRIGPNIMAANTANAISFIIGGLTTVSLPIRGK